MSLELTKAKFWVKKHSPELLVAGGITCMVGSIVSAIIATTKVKKITEPASAKIDEIKNSSLEEKTMKKELTKTYAVAGLKVAGLYLPCALTFAASVSCIIGSHNIMKGRNLALAAAYTTLDNGYRAYRKRVAKEIGDEAEEKIYKDVYKEKQQVVDENGEVKDKKVNKPHIDPDSNFEVLYDIGQRGWERNALLNFRFLMNQQEYLNTKLRCQGYLFLSDVYDALGYDVTNLGPNKMRAAHVLGWIYDPKDKTRDNFVSFGITEPGTTLATKQIQEQIDNNEPTFWLSFNVDGDILSGDDGKKKFTDTAKEGCC